MNNWKNRHIYRHGNEIKTAALTEYAKGLSTIQVANKLKISKYVVWKWTKDVMINRSISEAKLGKNINHPGPPPGIQNPNFKRGYRFDKGYISISLGQRGKEKRKHVLIAEKALGRSLKKGEMIHHINRIKTDNLNSNLIICTRSYHRWLHSKEFTSRLQALR